MLETTSLRFRVFLFFAFVALGGVAAVCGALWLGYRQLGNGDALSAFVTSGTVAAFVIVGLVTWVWMLFDENVAKAVDRLATDMRARAHADIDKDLDQNTARYLGDLAPAAAAVTANLTDMKNGLAQQVMRETTRISGEKAHLKAVLSDLPTGVVICTAEHQVVFYNGRARDLLERCGSVGLDRSLAGLLGAAPIEAAYAQLMEASPEACADLRIDIPEERLRLGIGMRLLEPLPDSDQSPAYVLTLRQAHLTDLPCGSHIPVPREAVFDFDLMHARPSKHVMDRRLDDLCYVIFDTETTGLMPDRGDEVCQIAATRIVGGKIVNGEVLDTLVNPGRKIPLSATNVHGITDAMVQSAPDFVTAGQAFHNFADGAVLIAHNAPFDMAFFYRAQAEIGVRFDHPVLDTVLLSAVLYGQAAQHSLDAIAERLSVTIPEEARHTALGDALATTEVFLKMLPMLKARGIETFGELLAETRKHGRLLEDLNTA
ncbi:MAG: 3'-5' exonuclease [Pseudomonadota bacterium]